MTNVSATERQSAVLAIIEAEIAAGRPVANMAELSQVLARSADELAPLLDALEHLGFITRIRNRRRNIWLCSPSMRMAPDHHLILKLTRRGYLVRKGEP